MPHYRQPMPLRILEASGDILRTYPEFPNRKRWIDRFFYRSEDGVAQIAGDALEGSGAVGAKTGYRCS